ncbi:hypothetical protein [Coprobacter secundus]|uniref:hypothetical protein n=1 Tax=Coprobacter secundus TaxID=1501392 RepID=UPI0022E66B2F|nr:hypothetical protein [Coprobacter secundus]
MGEIAPELHTEYPNLTKHHQAVSQVSPIQTFNLNKRTNYDETKIRYPQWCARLENFRELKSLLQ